MLFGGGASEKQFGHEGGALVNSWMELVLFIPREDTRKPQSTA
jgi:hypothetical protein